MNFGSCLFAVLAFLAFGALSMNSAMAEHQGHGSHSTASDHHSSAGSRAGTARDSGSKIKGAVADHAKDDGPKDGARHSGIGKGSGEDEHHHARKSEGAGVSTQGHNASGREHAADDAIDTRIPMRQERETAKKMRHLKSSDVDAAARNGFKHEHARRGEASVRSSEPPRRNAVGATVDRDKPGERRNVLGVAVAPKGTPDLETKSNPAPLATGAATHDPGTGHPAGKVPVDGSLSGAAQGTQGNRRDAATAVTVATTSGLSISGTGMIRPRSTTAVIGGAPKIAVGVLSGNSFRPKHP
jgi:hypothetical protein